MPENCTHDLSSPENVYVRPNGRRECRLCKRAKLEQWRADNRAHSNALARAGNRRLKDKRPPCYCQRCGVVIVGKRYAAKWCSERCKKQAAADAQRRKATLDPEYAERRATWRREAVKRHVKRYPERVRARAAAAPPEVKAARMTANRRWKADNREKTREHVRRAEAKRRQRPEVKRQYADKQARRRAKAPAVVDRFRVWFLGAGRCGICSDLVDLDTMHVDHIIPLCRGGAHDLGNLQVAHPVCNCQKGGG